ncbi:hypothetical protein H8I91_13290 [Serratia fonticola]|uniref:hypothetical protein n=1 Tax=Serratia fonticola TaxID=47917 RepID=UPI001648019D|nr:hypothetical protein [Serratia fonticola]MBC3251244.1 hypothetical protein [Serratia fonticola]
MAVTKTHTGTVITRTGEKNVQLHQNPTTWVAGPKEYYYKDTGRRGGAVGVRTRLVLSSIRPIDHKEG